MSAKRQPEAGVHRLRMAILQAVADSNRPLHGSDVVEKFAKSGWTFPPSVKDVRHAVRWLEGRGLVEWHKAPHDPGKELHLTSAGHRAARHGFLGQSQSKQGEAAGGTAPESPWPRRGAPEGVDREPAVARHLPSLVRNANRQGWSLPC